VLAIASADQLQVDERSACQHVAPPGFLVRLRLAHRRSGDRLTFYQRSIGIRIAAQILKSPKSSRFKPL
jgi:hypothetical protein